MSLRTKKSIFPFLLVLTIILGCLVLIVIIVNVFVASVPKALQFSYTLKEYAHRLKPINIIADETTNEEYSIKVFGVNYENPHAVEIFPKKLLSAKNNLFCFQQTVKHPGRNQVDRALIYLDVELNENDFALEKERLMNFTTMKGVGISVSQDLFEYPTVVAQYNYQSKFQYAIIDEDRFTIKYIYLDEVFFENEYLTQMGVFPVKRVDMSDLRTRTHLDYINIFVG